MDSLGCETVVNGFWMIICSCMRSLRDPLLQAELNRDRKSSMWIFATEIMVRARFYSFSIKGKEVKQWIVFLFVILWLQQMSLVHQVTLPAIQVSVSELLFFNSLKKSTQTDNSQSRESRACLAYLLFVQLITLDSFPAVFRWDETWCDDAHSPHTEETACSLTVQQQTINIVLFPPVPALYLFFSATWSTSINYSIGSLFIQYQLFLFGKDWIYDWIYNLVCLAAKMNRTCSKDW